MAGCASTLMGLPSAEWREEDDEEPVEEEEQPMQLGQARFSAASQRRTRVSVLCYVPEAGKGVHASVTVGILTSVSKLIFQLLIHPGRALIDSGAGQSFFG